MKRSLAIKLVTFLISLSQISVAQTPQLLRDFNTTKVRKEINSALVVNDKFTALVDNTATTGSEFFVSDGTPSGTGDLPEKVAGTGGIYIPSSSSTANSRYSRLLNGLRLDIVRYDDSWEKVRLIAGTGSLEDTTEISSFTELFETPSFIGEHGNKLYFSVKTQAAACNLYRTDGTTSGTVLVKTIVNGSDCTLKGIGSIGTSMLFTASTSATDLTIWRTNGNSADTTLVKRIGSTNAHLTFSSAIVSGTKGYLVVRDQTLENEFSQLWVSSGTSSGTIALNNITYTAQSETVKPSPYSGITDLLVGPNSGIFMQVEFNLGEDSRVQLWKSRGTEATTSRVSSNTTGYEYSNAIMGDSLYFTTDLGAGYELYKHSSSGVTSLVKDIHSGQESGYPQSMEVIGGNRLVFLAYTEFGQSLYISDGTSNGTIKIYGPSLTEPEISLHYSLTPISNGVFFQVDSPSPEQSLRFLDVSTRQVTRILDQDGGFITIFPGIQKVFIRVANSELDTLYVSNGTLAGTSEIASFITDMTGSSYPETVVTIGTKVLFTVYDGEQTTAWTSDGLPHNTKVLHDKNGAPITQSFVYATTVLHNQKQKALLITGTKIFLSDLTDAGTEILFDGETINLDWIARAQVITNSNKVIFSGTVRDPDTNMYILKLFSLSLTNNTVEVVSEFSGSSIPVDERYVSQIVASTTGVFIHVVGYSEESAELWYSNGIQTINLNPTKNLNFECNSQLVTSGASLYFVASTPSTGCELYKSNGTVEGTVLVKDITQGAESSQISNLMLFQNGIIFRTYTYTVGYTTYKSDGTAQGTVALFNSSMNINNIAAIYSYNNLHVVGSAMYFVCTRYQLIGDFTSAVGLCKSNGTPNHVEFSVILPNAIGWATISLKQSADQNALYIALDGADNPQDGYIGKITNGSLTLFPALQNDEYDLNIDNLSLAGDNLLFSARTKTFGNEFWSIAQDECTDDSRKTAPGMCGCGIADSDTDSDGVLDCSDNCPTDSAKTVVGQCGCGIPDVDLNRNGIVDCKDIVSQPPVSTPLPTFTPKAPKLKAVKGKKYFYTVTAVSTIQKGKYKFVIEQKVGKKWKSFAKRTIAKSVYTLKLKKGEFRINYAVNTSKFSPFTSLRVK